MVLAWAGRRWGPSALRPGRTSAAEKGASPQLSEVNGTVGTAIQVPGARAVGGSSEVGSVSCRRSAGTATRAGLALTASKRALRAAAHPESPGEQHRSARDSKINFGAYLGRAVTGTR